jgi:hypothetical protein
MKKSTPTKSAWSQKDLQEYLAEAVNAYKIDRDWPTVLNMLTKGGSEGDSDQPEVPHPAFSLAVTRRIQIVREYLRAIPRRRLTDGTEGKAIIPFHAEASAPRHKHVQLEGQFRSLVHIVCVWQELQWSWLSAIIFIAGDSHISYLYICHGHIYI